MSKAFTPGIFVPGAYNAETKDAHGRAVWIMPAPSAYVEHRTRRKGRGEEPRVVHGTVQVPVYRGFSASFARYMRNQQRRAARAESIKQALEAMIDV
jgi:hypothetical protein